MELNRENMRKIKELIVFTILILIALWKYTLVLDLLSFIFGILFPFLLGGAIAFVLNVPMNFIERKVFAPAVEKGNKAVEKLARPLSLIFTLLFVLGIILLVLMVVIPELGTTLISLGASIQDSLPKLLDWLEEVFANNKEVQSWISSLEMDWEKMLEEVVNFFKSGVGVAVGSTFSAAKSIISGLSTFFIAFVFSCYILLQKGKLRVQVQKVFYAYLPEKWVQRTLDIFSLTYKTFSNFLTGQCVEAVVLGAMFVVAMSVLRLPYALLVGVLIAFTALIPIFGAFIGCAVGAFLILMVDPMKALIFVILFLVLQQLEGNLIYPKVVGNSVGLPSIWVLAAVSVGGSLMGIVGMLIFIPLVSVLYTLFRENVYKNLKKKNIEL